MKLLFLDTYATKHTWIIHEIFSGYETNYTYYEVDPIVLRYYVTTIQIIVIV